MADSQFNDAAVLAGDPTFQGRIGVAVSAYIRDVVLAETPSASAGGAYIHTQRKSYAQTLLNNRNTYIPLFYVPVSADTNILSSATASGATPLTTSNVAAQAAVVTDTLISNAVSAIYNAFVPGI